MNTKTLLGLAGGLLALALLVGLATWWRHRMTSALPPQTVCMSRADAYMQALRAADGGTVLAIAGTGSMAPYIPAAPAGDDPLKTIVAYVVLDGTQTFADIRTGDLVCYHADWLPPGSLSVLHQAAQQDSSGWIMSGLHNATSEASWRVTSANFIGIASRTFVWPQP